MTSGLPVWIRSAREQADIEHSRAGRAATIARRHEALMTTGPEGMRAVHERLARIHRVSEERHLTAAKLHEMHARRLGRWMTTDGDEAERPRLITSVAEMVNARSAGITLLNSRQSEAAVISSDTVAAAAQDLELTLGEGPVHDAAATARPMVVAPETLMDRWQHYSPAIAALGVRSLAVVPLGPSEHRVGALTVFDPSGTARPKPLTAKLEVLADAVTHTMLLTDECVTGLLDESAPSAGTPDILDSANRWLVVHQAAGMVAAQCECSVDNALLLIRAHSFAQNRHVTDVARSIIDKQLRLDRGQGESTP
ncbi:GAF and ANTAR domain-containing protein [Kribbella sp. NPDC048915]|uniref:GAF and ANTAR domain-containing protein n=1 Tax=Kribbella sp. NPDC048915 TaxID=3155148 RepID=UPI00340AFB05